jgi:hypothetical protein
MVLTRVISGGISHHCVLLLLLSHETVNAVVPPHVTGICSDRLINYSVFWVITRRKVV